MRSWCGATTSPTPCCAPATAAGDGSPLIEAARRGDSDLERAIGQALAEELVVQVADRPDIQLGQRVVGAVQARAHEFVETLYAAATSTGRPIDALALNAGIGLGCDTGASWTLPRLVGPTRALELMYSGRTVTAACELFERTTRRYGKP